MTTYNNRKLIGGGAASETTGFLFYGYNDDDWRFYWGLGPDGHTFIGDTGPKTDITIGEWTHLAASFEPSSGPSSGVYTGTMRFYVNGLLIGEETGTKYKPNETHPVQIGGAFGAGFPGAIDETRLWNRVLSAKEIRGSMTSSAPQSTSGLIAHWAMENGHGTTITDASGGGHDASVTSGSPTWISDSPHQPVISGVATADDAAAIRYLNASKLALTEIDRLTWTPNLEALSLAHNSLDNNAMPVIAGLTKLRELDLTGNALITDVSSLVNLQQLQILRLEGTGIDPFSDAVTHLVDSLPNLRVLTLPVTDLPSDTNVLFYEGETRLINGKEITATDDGRQVVAAFGINVPIFARNVAPTVSSIPSLTSLVEGDVLSLAAPVTGADYQRSLLSGGTSIGNITIADRGSADIPDIATSISIVDPSGNVTDLSHAAARFAGDALRIPAGAIDGGTNLTVSFWLKTSQTGAQRIVEVPGKDPSTAEFTIELVNATTLRLASQGEAISWTIPSVADDAYRLFAITRDLNNNEVALRLYDNTGAAIAITSAESQTLTTTQTALDVAGPSFVVGRGFTGTLDELTLWKRALPNTDDKGVDTSDLANGKFQRGNLDLIGYWPFNEGGGDVAADASRYAHDGRREFVADGAGYFKFDQIADGQIRNSGLGLDDGKQTGGVGLTSASGIPGVGAGVQTAAVFDGVDDRISIPSNELLRSPSFTVSGWFRIDGGQGTARIPLATYTNNIGGGDNQGFMFYAQTDNTWRFYVGDGASSAPSRGGPAVVPGQWIHLAGTFEHDGSPKDETTGAYNGTLAFYVNGVRQGSAATNVKYEPASASIDLALGGLPERAQNPQFYFTKGAIDKVQFYSRALSQAEITAMHGASEPASSSPTSSHWSGDVPAPLPRTVKLPGDDHTGKFQLLVLADDGDGGVVTSKTEFTVGNVAPTIGSLGGPDPATYAIGNELSFNASSVIDPGGDDIDLVWQVTSNNGQEIPAGSEKEFSFTPQYAGTYTLTLSATDNVPDGGGDVVPTVSAPVTINIAPQAVITSEASSVAGSPLSLTSEKSSLIAPAGLLGTDKSIQRGANGRSRTRLMKPWLAARRRNSPLRAARPWRLYRHACRGRCVLQRQHRDITSHSEAVSQRFPSPGLHLSPSTPHAPSRSKATC
ncbi:MAG: LamG-like jellyroll fold domain-containing protein [Pirellulaceae bacterium]